MYHVFLLILALTGQPAGVMESTAIYDTKDACLEHEQEFADKGKEFLEKNGLNERFSVAASRCATEDEMKGKKDDNSI